MRSRSAQFANFVFVGSVSFLLCVLLYLVYIGSVFEYSKKLFVAMVVVGIFVLLFLWILRRCGDTVKTNCSIAIVSLGCGVYACELYLTVPKYIDIPNPITIIQWEYLTGDVQFDRRSLFELIDDYKREGEDIYPALAIAPERFIGAGGDALMPLGGISHVKTTLSNELGPFQFYDSDEHGFRNPLGKFSEDHIDVVLIGDSFVHGINADDDELMSEHLIRAGYNTVNLGYIGNGPIVEYACFREYVEMLKPTFVFWMWYPNDIDDMLQELRSAALMRYMDDDTHSQDLIHRQEEIDQRIQTHLDTKIEENKAQVEIRASEKPFFESAPVEFLKLTYLRSSIGLVIHPYRKLMSQDERLAVLMKVLKKAKNKTGSWGGELYFAYLPSVGAFEQVSGEISPVAHRDLHARLLKGVRELGIPVIDALWAFDSSADPLAMYPFKGVSPKGIGNYHYNADGYKLVADTIIGELKSR